MVFLFNLVFMKKTEIILFILIIISFIMKVMNLPYNTLLITFSIILLAFLYLTFGFALLNGIRFRNIFKPEGYKTVSILRIFAGIALGFVLSTLVIYCLFKLQFWPYGQQGLQLSLVMLAIVVAVMFVFYFMGRKQFLKTNQVRLLIIGILSLSLYFTSSDNLVDLYYGDNPEYAKAFKDYLNNPSPNAERPEYYDIE